MNKIYIWGTGYIAKMIIEDINDKEIQGYIETKKSKNIFGGKLVYQCDEMTEEYDAIIVANIYSEEIYETASKYGYDLNKFIFMRKCHLINPLANIEWKRNILGKINFQRYVAEYGLQEYSFFEEDKQLYTQLNKRSNFQIEDSNDYPILKDKFNYAGMIGAYFWQDLWAAKLIYKNKPLEHYDIGSRLDGFIAHVLSLKIPVHIIDIRPFPTQIEGLDTIVGDATNLDVFADDSIESLSALCSLEHFGLGRYGDSIDPEACFKCFSSIQKKLKVGGHLYLSVPIGKERVEFNAHRIFYPTTIIECFKELKLLEFSCADSEKIEKDVGFHKYDEEYIRGGTRFGLFHFIKI